MSVENRPPNVENLDNSASRLRDAEGDANGEDALSGGSLSPVAPPDLQDSVSDDDDLPDVMTASYSEICLDEEDDGDLLPGEIADLAEVQDATQGINELVDQIKREEELEEEDPQRSRPRTLGLKCVGRGGKGRSHQATTDSQATSPCSSMMSSEEVLDDPSLDRRYGSDASGLSDLHGTLTYEGEMVSFVAENLQEKIKLSSPVTKVPAEGISSFPASRSSTPGLHRQLLTPPLGPVDPSVLAELEAEARAVAASVDSLLENLSGSMHSISAMTVDCMRLYEKGMCKTCDVADSNIKAMYQLMAKYEELSNSMKPLYSLANEVKGIKKLLDIFESTVDGKT